MQGEGCSGIDTNHCQCGGTLPLTWSHTQVIFHNLKQCKGNFVHTCLEICVQVSFFNAGLQCVAQYHEIRMTSAA